IEAARTRLEGELYAGKALACLRSNIEAQSGDPRVCDAPGEFLPLVKETVKVESPRSGFITTIDTTEIGHAIAAIGGGRGRIEDTVDPTVGFTSELKLGDQVSAGETIGIVYCADPDAAAEASRRIQDAYHIGDEAMEL